MSKEMSHQESLALISTMINKAKESYKGTGMDSIMWGMVIAICSLVKFCELQFQFQLPFDIYLLTVVAAVIQIIMAVRENKNRKVRNYADDFISPAWLGFGICIGLLIHVINLMFINYIPMANQFETLAGHRPEFRLGEYMMPLFLILYGLPTFITGLGCKFRPMLIGGIVCWICSIITVYSAYKVDLLLTALSAIVAWFVPGILMLIEYKKHKKLQEVANV